MKRCLYTIILVIQVSVVSAQAAIPDSLHHLLSKMADDSGKVKHLIKWTVWLPYVQTDSAHYYADSIIRLSEKINFPYGLADGNDIKAESYTYQGDFARGLSFIQLAMQQYESLENDFGLLRTTGQLGALFSELGAYEQALYYSGKALNMVNSYGDSIYNRITEKYETTGPLRLSRNYEYAKIFLAFDKLDSALAYAGVARDIDRQINFNYTGIPVMFGDIYFQKKDYQIALKYYNATPDRMVIDKAKSLIGKAKVFANLHLRDSAIIYAQLSLEAFRKINYTKGTMQAAGLLSELYEADQPLEAIRYYRMSNAMKDSMYSKEKVNLFNTIIFNEELRRIDAEASEVKARNRYKIWSLLGGILTLLITGILLWRNVQHRKSANLLLQKEKQQVEATLEKLKSTQAQLIQSEKMASLGELTAGIAHEIQNPLNFVNNFSEVNKDLLEEVKNQKSNVKTDDLDDLLNDILLNNEKILHHGKRADAIVKGMLQHSSSGSGAKEPTNINALADEYLRLAYHGLKANDKSFNATIKTDLDQSIGNISIIPQDIGRVLLNLYNNAFYAVNEKKKQIGDGYEPEVRVSTKLVSTLGNSAISPLPSDRQESANSIIISVRDNGNGIPQKILDKIFQPFFTTKPTGQGTGLGLSLSYDIIKAHSGGITVESKEWEGSEFIIRLPVA